MNTPASKNLSVPIAALVLAVVTLAAYLNTFHAPWIYDDGPAIVENTSIRDLTAWREVLSPPVGSGLTVGGRPMLNLSLALNYAVGGTDVLGYRIFNVAMHIGAGLLLFGLARRTLLGTVLRERFGKDALPLALGVAALWVLHPLDTESVTYTIQRAESLAAFFSILTLYAFARGAESATLWRWWTLAIATCACGMATKETAVTTPFIVWVYDWCFIAGNFRDTWKRRWSAHVGLASTWILLACLMASTGWNRGGSMGLGINIPWWKYALTQPRALTTYLRLSLWPHPLSFSYEADWVTSAWPFVAYAALIIALVVGTIVALRRCPPLGFLGVLFFATLSPTSSVIASAFQTTVEHRVYLALVAPVALVVFGIYALLGRRSWVALIVIALALAATTARRNYDYRSVLSIWADAAAKRPDNPIAHHNAGSALLSLSRWDEAIAHYEAVLRLEPGTVDSLYNLGNAFLKKGRTAEAIGLFREALRVKPDDVGTARSLADALLQAERFDESMAAYADVLRITPHDADAHYNFADALASAGRWPEAIEHYEAALRERPGSSSTHNNLGNALLATGRPREAFEHFTWAVKLDPNNARAHYNLGNSLASTGRFADAVVEFDAAARLEPANADAHNNLGVLLAKVGRAVEARAQFEEALHLRPDFTRARANLDGLPAK